MLLDDHDLDEVGFDRGVTSLRPRGLCHEVGWCREFDTTSVATMSVQGRFHEVPHVQIHAGVWRVGTGSRINHGPALVT